MSKNVLLVDFGSTFVKCLVYRSDSEEVYSKKLPFPKANRESDTEFVVLEKDINNLVNSVVAMGVEYGCENLFISVQMHGYLLRNANGTMTDYISWKDKSGDITCVERENIDFNARGTSLKANLPFVKLYKYRDKLQGAEFYTLGSYIAYLLTGNNITHKTDACASGFYNAQSLDAQRLGGIKLPIALHAVEVIGKCGEMNVYAPMGDHQISYLGSAAGKDKYLVNVGTATQISCFGKKEHLTNHCERRPYFTSNEILYTVTGLTGGEQIYQGVGEQELFRELMHAISILPKRKAMLFGGGGGRQAYMALQEALLKENILCSLLEKNIGMEGLKWISKQALCCQK